MMSKSVFGVLSRRSTCQGVLSRGLASAAQQRAAIVVGGGGALGRAVVESFADKGWTVISIDVAEGAERDGVTHTKVGSGSSCSEQLTTVREAIAAAGLSEAGVDAVVCTAGGWAGGSASDPAGLAAGADAMLAACVVSSSVAAAAAGESLNSEGLLVLTGSAASLDPVGTPGMIGYGMAKAATHHIGQSLAHDDSGLGTRTAGGARSADVLTVCPNVIDTPGNRAGMPGADFSAWTPAEVIASRVERWAGSAAERPANGTVLVPITAGGQTVWSVGSATGVANPAAVVAVDPPQADA